MVCHVSEDSPTPTPFEWRGVTPALSKALARDKSLPCVLTSAEVVRMAAVKGEARARGGKDFKESCGEGCELRRRRAVLRTSVGEEG